MTEQENKMFELAEDLGSDISKVLDRHSERTDDPRHMMSAFGYAVSMIVQGQALLNGTDPVKEVAYFARYLVAVSQTFRDKTIQAPKGDA